jgi:glycosyltransferase involved in cell wall biosynthesis
LSAAAETAAADRPETSTPIRLRVEHTRYPHWGQHSGSIQFVRALDPQRFQVVVHGASDSHADLPLRLRPHEERLRQLIRRGGLRWYKLSDLNAELEALKASLSGRHDIVHFQDGEHSGQFLPRLLKRARRYAVRTVATFHQPPAILQDIVNPALLQWFDAILLVSPSQLPFFLPHVPENRMQALLVGVDADFFHPAPGRNETQRIRCITTGHWLRDWDVFARVATLMSDVTFEVVSSASISFDGLSNVVRHRGISDAALAGLYRSADILFLPLIDATANNALLEGIASGLPVVATELAAVRAYVPGREALLVEASSGAQGFVDALRALQADVALRHAMGRQARARAEKLAWPRQVREYEAFYARVKGLPHRVCPDPP